METRAHHILIGSLTLLAAGILLFFTLWMSRDGLDGEMRNYRILFRESVSGLSVGSAVRYGGIRVGEVERLWLDEQDPRLVWAQVRVSTDVPIRTDTSAQLTLLNITGSSVIELSPGQPGSPLLESDDGIPVIEADPSSLARLRVSSDELAASITTLLDRANTFLSEENTRHVQSVLANIDTITSLVASQEEELREGIQNLAGSGAQINRILIRLEERLETDGDLLMAEASATLGSIRSLSEQLEQLLAENSQVLVEGMQSVGDLGPAMADLRSLLSRLNAMSRRLETGPAGVLLDNDNIREFNP